ncbi:MAG: hypothetical protein ACLR9Z_01310 [Alitiscatomonas sp.]
MKNARQWLGFYRLQVEARFEYEKKQEQLADTQITSPIDGTVVRVNTKVGRFDSVEDSSPYSS